MKTDQPLGIHIFGEAIEGNSANYFENYIASTVWESLIYKDNGECLMNTKQRIVTWFRVFLFSAVFYDMVNMNYRLFQCPR